MQRLVHPSIVTLYDSGGELLEAGDSIESTAAALPYVSGYPG